MYNLNCKTPKEMWSGKLADYDNLLLFRDLEFVHHKKDKLEAWTKRRVFNGQEKGVKGISYEVRTCES